MRLASAGSSSTSKTSRHARRGSGSAEGCDACTRCDVGEEISGSMGVIQRWKQKISRSILIYGELNQPTMAKLTGLFDRNYFKWPIYSRVYTYYKAEFV